MRFIKDLGTLLTVGTAAAGPRQQALEGLNAFRPPPPAPLCSISGESELPGSACLCAAGFQFLVRRQQRGSVGRAGANLQSKAHLFFCCSEFLESIGYMDYVIRANQLSENKLPKAESLIF